MEIGIQPLIFIAIFGGILLVVEAIYIAIFGKSISFNSKVNRRIEMLKGGEDRQAVIVKLRKEQDQHKKAKSLPFYAMIADKAEKGGIAFPPTTIFALMGGLGAVSFVAMLLFTSTSIFLQIPLSVAFGIGAVYFWINNKAKKRVSMMEEQLADAVELVVRGLRVGHPLNAAIAMVAEEMQDPIASEMGIIADEATYGRDVSESLRALGEVTGLHDFRFLSVAIAIQQKSGGNLAEILENLAKVIRARFKLFRKVKTITSEAAWSGKFLSGFPILMILLLNLIKPDYFDEVKDSAAFVPLACTVAVMLLVNLLYMKKMVNIKV